MADYELEEREVIDDADKLSASRDYLISDSVVSKSFDIGADRENRRRSLVYLQCYFVTVAVVLGPGVLGLPVKLSHSGFTPFAVVLGIGVLVEVLVVCYFVDLLQQSYVIKQCDNQKAALTSDEDTLLQNDGDDPEVEEKDDNDDDDDNKLEKEVEVNRNGDLGVSLRSKGLIMQRGENHLTLNTLAELFLGSGVRQLFEAIVLLIFISTLICHSLVGSQIYAQLLNLNVVCTIPMFVWSCAFLILFLQSLNVPFVSLLAFLEASLILTATGCVGVFLGRRGDPQVHTNFKDIGEPFVLVTVTLGSVVNILPLLFAKIKPLATEIRGFCLSIIAGLLTCTCIIVLWCYALLKVVPQQECFAEMTSSHQTTSLPVPCVRNQSMQWAQRSHELSVVPVVNIINANHPEYIWLAGSLQTFVAVSITVSFLIIGAGMKHMVDGWLDSFYYTPQSSWQEVKSKWEALHCKAHLRWFLKTAALLSLFGFVFAVALLNPTGTVTVLENVISVVLNVECGVFILFMLRRSYNDKSRYLRGPVPLMPILYHLQYFVAVYFLAAVGCNIADIVHAMSVNQTSANMTSSVAPGAGHFTVEQIFTARNHSMGSDFSSADVHNRRWRLHDNPATNGTL